MRAGLVLSVLLAGQLTGCEKDPTGAVRSVATVEIAPPPALFLSGDSLVLGAAARDADGDTVFGADFLWASANPNVVSINASTGLARAVDEGTTTISVSVAAASDSIGLTVTVHAATYEVRFDAEWSEDTHPTSFPPGPHFSGLIGGTHSSTVAFWMPGGLASEGIKNMAEGGQKAPLDSEVEQAILAGTAHSVLSGPGISLSPGSAALTLEVNTDYPLVTLVSMIAPSPDWFGRKQPVLDGGWCLARDADSRVACL